MAFIRDLIKFYFIFGLRRGEILQLLNRLDDMIIDMGTLGQVFKKAWDMGEGRMSASLWRWPPLSAISEELKGHGGVSGILKLHQEAAS